MPIRSIIPIIPREEGSPPCYIVLGEKLEQAQVNALAEMLLEKWSPECSSIEQASQYILEGLPLKTSHFNGCGTNDRVLMKAMGFNDATSFAYLEFRDDENHS